MAAAGVGSPMNELCCRSSILNFASLKADIIARKRGTKQTSDLELLNMVSNSITEGSTPKLTISARESSSLPRPELALSILAANPSKKSKTAAASIRMKAGAGDPFNVRITPRIPHRRFMEVIASGMYFRIRKLTYLMPSFLRRSLGRASLWTMTSMDLPFTKFSEQYQIPLYLPVSPQEFFTM